MRESERKRERTSITTPPSIAAHAPHTGSPPPCTLPSTLPTPTLPVIYLSFASCRAVCRRSHPLLAGKGLPLPLLVLSSQPGTLVSSPHSLASHLPASNRIGSIWKHLDEQQSNPCEYSIVCETYSTFSKRLFAGIHNLIPPPTS